MLTNVTGATNEFKAERRVTRNVQTAQGTGAHEQAINNLLVAGGWITRGYSLKYTSNSDKQKYPVRLTREGKKYWPSLWVGGMLESLTPLNGYRHLFMCRKSPYQQPYTRICGYTDIQRWIKGTEKAVMKSMKLWIQCIYTSGPSPPGTIMAMWLPLRRICASFDIRLPFAVNSNCVTSTSTMLT